VIRDHNVPPLADCEPGTSSSRRLSRRRAMALLLAAPSAAWVGVRGVWASRLPAQARRLVRGEPIFSESVYLDAVTADGRAGFVARIGRFPEARVAWVWGHVFTPELGMRAFVDHEAPDDGKPSRVEADEVRYEGGSGEANMRAHLGVVRTGPRLAPRSVTLTARLPLRPVAAAGGEESVTVAPEVAELAATWQPRHAVFESLTGRSEVLGATEATLRLGGAERSVRGFGHFHEQHQEQPRFTTPFVYATLRGVRFSCIAIRSRGADRGFAVREPGSQPVAISTIGIGPLGDTRRLRLELADGNTLLGRLDATYRYTNELFGVERKASIVRGEVGGEPVSGCVNDFLEGELDYPF
jgi:hypothetical protein